MPLEPEIVQMFAPREGESKRDWFIKLGSSGFNALVSSYFPKVRTLSTDEYNILVENYIPSGGVIDDIYAFLYFERTGRTPSPGLVEDVPPPVPAYVPGMEAAPVPTREAAFREPIAKPFPWTLALIGVGAFFLIKKLF